MPYVEPNPELECIYKNITIAVDASCNIVANSTLSLQGKCGAVPETNLIVKDPGHSTTLIKEFGISCSSFMWKEAGLTAFTIGAITMVPFLSSMADKYGRRPMMLASLTSAFICHMLASLAPNYYLFILLRFLIDVPIAILGDHMRVDSIGKQALDRLRTDDKLVSNCTVQYRRCRSL
ncbi:unnamed protein product [Strongylus vulgaris]|uniref:Major facilitator superfamily (MFS) profile domain-containing protein n=1 Tax=Strongylus vulgaris TaxID=40348 RepID=A0A3P7IJU7_STRVU|nr:unnamed protein product [Strongylus vulgaris]